LQDIKKRPAASSEQLLEDSTRWQRRLCGEHGGRFGFVSPPARPSFFSCVHRRIKQADGRRSTRTSAKAGETNSHGGPRVRSQRVDDIFIEVAPLRGRRRLEITQRRTRQDWAGFSRGILDQRYPQATKVSLVMDNLNPHTAASLFEAYPPEEARRLAEQHEIHYTPKHGRWLNIAEIKLSVLATQCLDRQIHDVDTMRRKVSAWESDRNKRGSKTNRRFSTADARTKLKRLYPAL
jgi:hypothetical protein